MSILFYYHNNYENLSTNHIKCITSSWKFGLGYAHTTYFRDKYQSRVLSESGALEAERSQCCLADVCECSCLVSEAAIVNVWTKAPVWNNTGPAGTAPILPVYSTVYFSFCSSHSPGSLAFSCFTCH